MIPVVFVHGVRTSSEIWTDQVRALEGLGHDVSLVDLPGHGTRLGEDFSLTSAISAIDEAVSSYSTPPILVGMSLGGYSSLSYAALNSEKISGLFLSGCSTEIKGKPLGLYHDVSVAFARVFGRKESWSVVAQMLKALRGHSSLRQLEHVSVPVWMVNGSRDFLRLGERAFKASGRVARLLSIPGAGHDVNLDAPAAFNRALLNFASSL